MPEGPEVRREADQIGAVLNGQILSKVEFGLPRLQRFAPALQGQRVDSVTSRGKAMLVHFDNGLTLFSPMSSNTLTAAPASGQYELCAARLSASRRTLRS